MICADCPCVVPAFRAFFGFHVFHHYVFFATYEDATRQRPVAMWGLPVAIVKAKPEAAEAAPDVRPLWTKLFRESQTALQEDVMMTGAELNASLT
jgi:hypothetical protein